MLLANRKISTPACHSERSEESRSGFFAPLRMTALHMRSCHHRLPWERGRPARMQARCLRSLIRQQHPKASGYGYKARPRGLIEPAFAGFVNVAEGFSPTASDVDVPSTPHTGWCALDRQCYNQLIRQLKILHNREATMRHPVGRTSSALWPSTGDARTWWSSLFKNW